jgi:DNA processing protein
VTVPAPALLDPGDPRPEVAAELRAWLALQRALALRPQDALAALMRCPEPRAALRLARAAPAPPAALEVALRVLRRVGAVALPWTSPAYPERARQLADAAPLLLVRGDPALLSRPAVAVVGARAASAYGLRAAEHFSRELAAAGLVIVSGLATGIDAVAHRTALAAGAATIAVQACGPDRVYPARHAALAEEIARHGALVTEFPPGTRPRPGFFPLRNRLIAALSEAVLVVEARARSGSLVTASHAAAQGVDVWAVPGPLGAPASEGANRLLYDGAYVALAPELILERLRARGVLAPAPRRRARRRAHAAGAPSEAQHRILAALAGAPATRDELARRLGCAPAALAVELLELELAGEVALDRDGRLRSVSPEPTPGL